MDATRLDSLGGAAAATDDAGEICVALYRALGSVLIEHSASVLRAPTQLTVIKCSR